MVARAGQLRPATTTPGHTLILLGRTVVMRRVCLPGLLGLALLASGTAFAADQQATPKADAAKKTETTKKTESTTKTETHTANKPVAGEAATTETGRKTRTRLPMHFGRIGLTAEQRQQMKAVEDKYAGEIKELETKLKEVRAKQTSELHALLSEAQKKALAEAHAAASKLREERKAVVDKAMALSAERAKEIKARFEVEKKKTQAAVAKIQAEQERLHADRQEKKAVKEKAAQKEAPKTETKEEQKPAEKTDKK